MREKDFLPGEHGKSKSIGNDEEIVFLKALSKHDLWLRTFLPFLMTTE